MSVVFESPVGPSSYIADDGAAAEQVAALFRELRDQIADTFVGQQEVVELVLYALLAGGHVLIEGVPGLGKTLLVRTLADALHLPMNRIQFTPDLMPADITGTTVLTEVAGGGHELKFQPGPLIASLVLADEINRATPKTQSALLEAVLLRVTQPWDTNPELTGDAELQDCETDARLQVSAEPEVLARYQAAYRDYFNALDAYTASRGVTSLTFDASTDTLGQLERLFPGGMLSL